MAHHSHEDALSESEFDDLLAATEDIKPRFRQQCRFLVVAAGRLGLRAGEIAHVHEDWVDWDEQIIHIPSRHDCNQGRDGGICGYCRDRAEAAVAHDESLCLEDALAARWQPKTRNSARAVPFGFNQDVVDAVEGFFFHHRRWPASRSAVNRRCDRALRAAGFREDRAYPHSLRATAATYHAYRGVPPAALQSLFGWAELRVAQKYIRLSGGATRDALLETHS